MMPAGLVIWILSQLYLSESNLSNYLNGMDPRTIHLVRVIILSLSFFSCLTGMFFLVFSREKEEDEYVADVRLKSFQLAAFVQLTFFLVAFLYMFLFQKEPSGDAGLELFLIGSIFLFWFSYLCCFHFAITTNKLQANEE
jgi:uncharacterized membrane protein YozB (DUF420 family)